MNNENLGQVSAWVAAVATILFAVFMILPNKILSGILSYAVCIVLSFGYLGLACAFAVTAAPERKASANFGMALAAVYAVFINLVYYSQLTTVLHKTAAVDVLEAITYQPGSWMFNLDMFGYGVMSLSTFFMGLSVAAGTRAERWMRNLMLVAGVFALSSIVMPTLNLFSDEGSDIFGILALEFWCLYFTPLMVLAAGYFKRRMGVEEVQG
jgi:hypothetical protein